MRARLFKLLVYFRHGHSTYLIFTISFLNFIVIQWRLMIERVDFLARIFVNIYVFIVSFLIIYIPIAVIIGWIDYRKGSVGIAIKEGTRVDPFKKDLTRALIYMLDGEKEKARKLLKKWV